MKTSKGIKGSLVTLILMISLFATLIQVPMVASGSAVLGRNTGGGSPKGPNGRMTGTNFTLTLLPGVGEVNVSFIIAKLHTFGGARNSSAAIYNTTGGTWNLLGTSVFAIINQGAPAVEQTFDLVGGNITLFDGNTYALMVWLSGGATSVDGEFVFGGLGVYNQTWTNNWPDPANVNLEDANIEIIIYAPYNFTSPPEKNLDATLPRRPVGQIRIGNTSLGQNQNFFYDANGTLVTLRQLQSGHRDSGVTYYTDNIPQGDFSTETWANATMRYAIDGGFNTLRIHMFWGYNDPFMFPSPNTVDSANFTALLTHLETLKAYNTYYALDGFLHGSPSWWFKTQMNNTGGMFWNTTVRDSFIFIWNSTLNEISVNSTAWDHLLYIEPWSEWFIDFGTNIILNSKDPFRYNGSIVGQGNSSLINWNAWLNGEFGGNATAVEEAFNEGTQDTWGMAGESAFFNVSMPSSSWLSGSVRQYYFHKWYQENISNFTTFFNNQIRASHPDVYISWDGFKPSFRFGGEVLEGDNEFSILTAINSSDFIDHHHFGALAADFTSWEGDRYLHDYEQMTAFGRAVGKPVIVGEQGPTVSGASGYLAASDDENVKNWAESTGIMLASGYAGWTPYWTSYWHAFETGANSRIARADARRDDVRQLNLLWEDAENWIDQQVYNNITVYYSLGTVYRDQLTNPLWRSITEGGYMPKYVVAPLDNETVYPSAIPADTEILIYGGTYYSNFFAFERDLGLITTWLAGSASRKLVLFGTLTQNFNFDTIRWENFFSDAQMPLDSVIQGTTYVQSSNNTDFDINVPGDVLDLNRSDAFNARWFANWTQGNIDGTWLVNETGGDPYVIASNQIYWVSGSSHQWFGASASRILGYERNIWKLFKVIFDDANILPIGVPTDNTRMVYSLSKKQDDWAVATASSLNSSADYAITTGFNITNFGLDPSTSYSFFNLINGTRSTKTATALESGLSMIIPANGTNTLVIRNTSIPAFLYSPPLLFNETWFPDNSTLKLEFHGLTLRPYDVYVYWTAVPDGDIHFTNGTTVAISGFFNTSQSYVKFGITFGSEVIVFLNGEVGWRGIVITVTNPDPIMGIAASSISRVNTVP